MFCGRQFWVIKQRYKTPVNGRRSLARELLLHNRAHECLKEIFAALKLGSPVRFYQSGKSLVFL